MIFYDCRYLANTILHLTPLPLPPPPLPPPLPPLLLLLLLLLLPLTTTTTTTSNTRNTTDSTTVNSSTSTTSTTTSTNTSNTTHSWPMLVGNLDCPTLSPQVHPLPPSTIYFFRYHLEPTQVQNSCSAKFHPICTEPKFHP